ncbi:MAG: carbonic anhydrase family protein, partial [Alphaproteobacteria bacterium]|nr:carbonic anhydrase family protein [Alphaproteobacteria bacterium]
MVDEKRTIDLSPITSLRDGYYHYLGSITTPPCTEGVRWYVLKHTYAVNKKQVDKLQEL